MRRPGPAKSSGARSSPSKSRPVGSGTPASRARVGRKSSCETRVLEVEPGAMRPGHTARPGSRCPPSQVLVFPVEPPSCVLCHSPRYGALSPP
eukprot:scaffold121281_cov48-Phaeocystis_antarctica.AAC.4